MRAELSLSSRGGGVGAQVVLKVLVAATVHGRSFGCNYADLGTGFVSNTEAVRPGWGRRDAHG